MLQGPEASGHPACLLSQTGINTMSDQLEKHEDNAHANRRGWRNIFILTGIVLIALGFLIFKDDAPPDDAWILPKFSSAVEGKNPLAVFIVELKKHPLQGSKEAPSSREFGDKDKEPAMREFVQKNESVSLAFDELMKTDPATWRWPGIDDKINFTFSFSGLSECQAIASQLQRMKIELLARDGKADEAAEEALKIIRYGNALSGAEGALIHYLVAITVERIGERGLQSALKAPSLSEAKLQSLQMTLKSVEMKPHDLCFALRVEYLMLKKSLYLFKADLSGASLLGISTNQEVVLFKYFMQDNRTLKGYLRLQKPVINAFEKDWAAIVHAGEFLKKEIYAWRADWPRFYVSPNVGGNMALALALPQFDVVIERGAIGAALDRQLSVMIALRRFELEKGKLPEKLDELVPKFLDAVPTDPFDNAPMRWNATDRVVYSIGKDLKDDLGAVSEPHKVSDKDVGMRYWWIEKEQAADSKDH